MMNNENGLGRIMGGVNGAIVETYNNRPFYLMSILHYSQTYH